MGKYAGLTVEWSVSRAFDSGVERKERRLTVDRLSGVVDYCAVEGV